MKQMIRNLWFNYRSEVFFGVVLFTLTVLSYWLGAFIPESVFENYVNPTEEPSLLESSLAETMVTMLCRNVTKIIITEEHQ